MNKQHGNAKRSDTQRPNRNSSHQLRHHSAAQTQENKFMKMLVETLKEGKRLTPPSDKDLVLVSSKKKKGHPLLQIREHDIQCEI